MSGNQICLFASLASNPFPDVRIGDLRQINEPGVAAVVGTRGLSQRASMYANTLDVCALALGQGTQHRAGEIALPYFDIGRPQIANRHELDELVDAQLGTRLPTGTGKTELLRGLTAQFTDMSDAIRGRAGAHGLTYSGDLMVMFMAKLPGISGAPLHRDAGTDMQGFVTIHGEGSIAASSRVRREISLPFANPMREQTGQAKDDDYGQPCMAFAEVLRRIPAQRMMLWRGALSENPFIHTEPDVQTDAQARLVAIVRPYENSGYYQGPR